VARQDAPSLARTARPRRGTKRAHGAATTRRRTALPSRGRSPILPITLLVGVAGLVVIAALIVLNGGAPTQLAASTLVHPASVTPTELAIGRSLGKPDAPVALEAWSDFQCPICGEFARTVEPALIARYVTSGTLRIVHHDAAFQGAKSGAVYDESVEAGAGARCAADQGRYWPFQDWAFSNQRGENQGAFAADRLAAIATSAGLDVPTWRACIATGQRQADVRAETQQAVSQGVHATPTLVVNGKVIVGLRSVAELSALIDAAATGG